MARVHWSCSGEGSHACACAPPSPAPPSPAPHTLSLCPSLRFIKNNLLVEVTSDRTLARLFYWALKHHSLISYCLYMAGKQPTQQQKGPGTRTHALRTSTGSSTGGSRRRSSSLLWRA